jgi:sporulation protein YlmC with PRC-barrel domain
MILGDLLGSPVHDGRGRCVGRVTDARFAAEAGPGRPPGGARLVGLVVSPHSASSFLGYERNGVTRPWPLAGLLRWRHRGSFLVLWEDIAALGPDAVRLREGYTAYSPALDDDGGGRGRG